MDNFYETRANRRSDRALLSNIKKLEQRFLIESFKREYSYNFDWMGLPIIQYPEDIIEIQELILTCARLYH